jgi:hypothetical protein
MKGTGIGQHWSSQRVPKQRFAKRLLSQTPRRERTQWADYVGHMVATTGAGCGYASMIENCMNVDYIECAYVMLEPPCKASRVFE